jgi:hypothetical protein
MAAISRGLSAATPPVSGVRQVSNLEGWQIRCEPAGFDDSDRDGYPVVELCSTTG